MIDLHSHVLPGLDDGAADLAESLDICRAAAADGIRVLAATPHVSFHYRTTPEAMEAALAQVRAAADGIVEVVGGGEVTLEELDRPIEELRRFALGGSSHLLVETPYSGWPIDIAQRLFVLRSQRVKAVLAHPERNADVQSRPELLQPLVDAGTLVQLTAASVDGRIGRRAQACARTLLDRGLAHLIASDAHAPEVRAVGMSAAARAVGDELARWLTVGVPGAILAGERIPERPAAHKRRGLFRR